jgi:hypothetical protein
MPGLLPPEARAWPAVVCLGVAGQGLVLPGCGQWSLVAWWGPRDPTDSGSVPSPGLRGEVLAIPFAPSCVPAPWPVAVDLCVSGVVEATKANMKAKHGEATAR